MKVRTFRAFYTVSLSQDSTGSGTQNNSGSVSQLSAINLSTMGSGGSQIPNTNPLVLKDEGYDIMGAKMFKLLSLSNASTTNIDSKALKANTSYLFEIKALLQEKINNNWVPVKNKSNNLPIKESKSMYFKTNSDNVGIQTNAAGSTQLKLNK